MGDGAAEEEGPGGGAEPTELEQMAKKKHRLVCLSGGSSIRWEFSGLRSLLTHECLQECVCVCGGVGVTPFVP